MTYTIVTNGHWRHTLEWYELTREEQRAPDDLKPWDGYHADSYFSGILC